MADFRFIMDERLRALVERDKREMDRCLEHRLCKSTILLAGSIIEAILVDFFLTFSRSGLTPDQVLRANLATLIEWAYQDGLITSRTRDLSTVIKDYRNLIHPGREYRLKERVDVHTATVAASLVEIVAQEIAENYARKRGYTAEQTINKIRLDPSCVPIFPHIVGTMIPAERVKLFRAIPEICKADQEAEAVVESFIRLHALLKENVPQEVVRTEALKTYNCTRNGTRVEVIYYLRFFADNLDMLEADQREAVITYLLSILEDGSRDELILCEKWRVYRQLGQFLDNEDGVKRLFEGIKRRLHNLAFTEGGDEAEKVFLSIVHEQILLPKMTPGRIATLVDMLRDLSWPDKASEWADYLEIPF